MTPSTIHSAIVALLTTAGFDEATTPWSLDLFPGPLHDGGYLLVPVVDSRGAPASGGAGLSSCVFSLALPWRLTGAPSTKARACMAAMETVVNALHGARPAGAPLDVGQIEYAVSDDGHRMFASVTLTATCYVA